MTNDPKPRHQQVRDECFVSGGADLQGGVYFELYTIVLKTHNEAVPLYLIRHQPPRLGRVASQISPNSRKTIEHTPQG